MVRIMHIPQISQNPPIIFQVILLTSRRSVPTNRSTNGQIRVKTLTHFAHGTKMNTVTKRFNARQLTNHFSY